MPKANLDSSLDECLAAIASREAEVRAWVEIAPRPSWHEKPMPFGAKDIFETANMATEYGSPLYRGRRGAVDAELVKLLESRGGQLMGKTQTTAFAYWDPAPTRNPLNPGHTPGGSSSGSVAAVATGMAAFAIGTQTQGSVIRPAAFCGICGFKPTHGVLPMDGCLAFAPTLDTAGLFTQTAREMRELWHRLGFAADARAPRRYLAFEMEGELSGMPVERLSANDTPVAWRRASEICVLISDYEGARAHEARYAEHGEAIGAKLSELVRRGLRLTAEQYEEALAELVSLRSEFDVMFEQYPAILTASALGPAPEGLGSTGDPVMNRAWTALGVPAITVRRPRASDGTGGLPLGLQIATARGQEAAVLAAACAWEDCFKEMVVT